MGAIIAGLFVGGALERAGNDLARRAIHCGVTTMVSRSYGELPTMEEAQDYCEKLLDVSENE